MIGVILLILIFLALIAVIWGRQTAQSWFRGILVIVAIIIGIFGVIVFLVGRSMNLQTPPVSAPSPLTNIPVNPDPSVPPATTGTASNAPTYRADSGTTHMFLSQYTTLNGRKSCWYHGFNVPIQHTITFTLSASQRCQANILDPDALPAFRSGVACAGHSAFNMQNGSKSCTLLPGHYYVAVRNSGNGLNSVLIQLSSDNWR